MYCYFLEYFIDEKLYEIFNINFIQFDMVHIYYVIQSIQVAPLKE